MWADCHAFLSEVLSRHSFCLLNVTNVIRVEYDLP